MSSDAIIGFILGLFSSLISGIVVFWLQERRDIQKEMLRQRREDIRTARNWAQDGKKASLRGFDLAGANLSGKDLSGADLEDANLEGAQMWETNFSGANLIRARFGKARLVGAKFNSAKLLLADFTGAEIREVDFSQAKMRRTKLGKPKFIENCVWTGVEIDETTELSEDLLKDVREQSMNKEITSTTPE